MPLVEPTSLREKILLIGEAGSGKTTAWLSIAWWAKQSGDTRKFFVMDTDDEAVLQVMNEPKYDGLLAEDGGNVHITSVREWGEYEDFSKKTVANAEKGDWIVLDFITTAWPTVQDAYTRERADKSRGETLWQAGMEGKTGWQMFEDMNWNAINGKYFDFLTPILIKSRAHVFMTAEQEVLDGNRLTDEQKEHIAQFSKFKAVGQKKLPYQCRSYLRVQRLARGRVLYTNGKDRARQEFNGETIAPDFFSFYLKGAAGWICE